MWPEIDDYLFNNSGYSKYLKNMERIAEMDRILLHEDIFDEDIFDEDIDVPVERYKKEEPFIVVYRQKMPKGGFFEGCTLELTTLNPKYKIGGE